MAALSQIEGALSKVREAAGLVLTRTKPTELSEVPTRDIPAIQGLVFPTYNGGHTEQSAQTIVPSVIPTADPLAMNQFDGEVPSGNKLDILVSVGTRAPPPPPKPQVPPNSNIDGVVDNPLNVGSLTELYVDTPTQLNPLATPSKDLYFLYNDHTQRIYMFSTDDRIFHDANKGNWLE